MAKPGSSRPVLRPVGVIRSPLRARSQAPRQGSEGAPDAWLEISPWAARALHRVGVGDEILILTWLDRARRDVLRVRPRSDRRHAMAGVFATRSPDRPNPIGLHPVVVRAIEGNRLRIGPIEAIDGTPVIDIKPDVSHGRAAPATRRVNSPGGRRRRKSRFPARRPSGS